MKVLCSQCGMEQNSDNVCRVDGKILCNQCMYGDMEPIRVYPIGIVRNSQKRAMIRFGIQNKSDISTIELYPSQKPFMYKLEEETHITVIYHLHKSKPVKSVFRRGLDGKKVGVFASRTPDRLSGLAIQDVRLVGIEDTTLYVEGLDAIDGSPVLDIKLCWKNRS